MIERKNISQQIYIYSLGALVGAISGLVAVSFRFLINGISLLFVAIPQVLGIGGWIIVPAIGGLFVAFIIVRYAPEAKGHGVPEVMESYTLHGGKMRLRVPFLKSLASAITIGSGGSCGREGPIAQIGAGIGSGLGAKLNLPKNETKTLVLCGLSSGIAATFNAPLGGALFGIEIIAGGIVGFSILPVILSSVIATAVADISLRAILGHSISLSFNAPAFFMSNPAELIFFLILGITLGVVSVVWMRGFYFIEGLFEKLRVSPYFLPAIGGLCTGALGVIAIYMEQAFAYSGSFGDQPYFPAVMGVEYAFIDTVLSTPNVLTGGVALLATLFIFGIMKILTTGATLGSGGSGGVFAPTLFVGAGLGGALGWIFAYIAPSVISPSTAMVFALVGMAALFGGSGRAPITCIVIIMEMTGDYLLILPLMIAVSSSFLVSSLIEPESIYTMKLSRRGVHISSGVHIGALKSVTVREIMTEHPTILKPDMTTTEVFKIIDETHHTKFPVVVDENRVIGILIAEDLFQSSKRDDGRENLVSDLMNPDFLHLTPGCTMDGALQAMMKRDEGHAVIANPMKPDIMIGYITKADVLKAYEIAILRLQKSGMDVEDITPAEIINLSG
ncbi:chloride channel protein [Candidatus Thorarchaeota archaeon]|nr:MAG: chloride channel protein [Candidatus Thorarchaeota archaeon]